MEAASRISIVGASSNNMVVFEGGCWSRPQYRRASGFQLSRQAVTGKKVHSGGLLADR